MSAASGIGWGGGRGAAPDEHGALLVGVAGPERHERAAARLAIRALLREELGAWSGLAPDRIALHGGAGAPPYALLQRAEGVLHVGLSISHEGRFSVAAWRPHGAVGVDLAPIVALPDCLDLARDYLGPEAAAALAARPPARRPAAFAQAWSAHEASLKCLGIGLVEWDAEIARRVAGCRRRPLAAPPGHAGCLAVPPAPDQRIWV